eukprot:7985-Heterococcus_DN1.PRE.1
MPCKTRLHLREALRERLCSVASQRSADRVQGEHCEERCELGHVEDSSTHHCWFISRLQLAYVTSVSYVWICEKGINAKEKEKKNTLAARLTQQHQQQQKHHQQLSLLVNMVSTRGQVASKEDTVVVPAEEVAEAAKPLESTAESTDDQTTGKRSAELAVPEDAADVKKAKTDDEATPAVEGAVEKIQELASNAAGVVSSALGLSSDEKASTDSATASTTAA